MKNKEFAEKNLGRIYKNDGLLVEVVGYLCDYTGASPGATNIVRYLSPDKGRGRAEGWRSLIDGDLIEKGYDSPDSVYAYVIPRYLKQLSQAEEVQAFAEAYKGKKFNLNGEVVTVVGYSTGDGFGGADYGVAIVARAGGWSVVEDSDVILFNSEQKTFKYVDYRYLKPIRK